MTNCSVNNCTNCNKKTQKKDGVSYFHFPKDPVRCAEWSAVIAQSRGKKKFHPNKWTVVCSEHFHTSDVYVTHKGRKRITKSALPMLNVDDNPIVTSDDDPEIQNMESEEPCNSEENSNDADVKLEDDEDENDSDSISHTTTLAQRNQKPSLSGFIVPSKKLIKKGKMGKKDEDIQRAIFKIDKFANSVTRSGSVEKYDEFDSFGIYIATTLRSLPKELAIVAQTDVQKAISEIQLRALRQDTQNRPCYVVSPNAYETQNPLYFSSESG